MQNECYICAKLADCRESIPAICGKCMEEYHIAGDIQEEPTPEIEVTDKMLNEMFPFTEGP